MESSKCRRHEMLIVIIGVNESLIKVEKNL